MKKVLMKKRMKLKRFILLTAALILCGCSQLDFSNMFSEIASEMYFWPGVSLHPLYTENEVIFEEKLIGTWGENGENFTFTRIEGKDSYNLALGAEGEKSEFIAVLVKLDDMLLIDVSPARLDPNSVNLQRFLFIPGHMFFKVEQIEPELKIRNMDPDPNTLDSLKHEMFGKYGLLITASTQELQEFVKKHTTDEVFGGEGSLGRKSGGGKNITTKAKRGNMNPK